MAITDEQAAAIATAIENLNKSVQVNEEVLQIVKSMQSTGAAGSVAEHAADLNAHTDLNNLNIRGHVGVTDYNVRPLSANTPWLAELTSTRNANGGISKVTLIGENSTGEGDAASLRMYTAHPNLENKAFVNYALGQVSFNTRHLEGDTLKLTARGVLACSTDATGAARMLLGVKGASGENTQYYFKEGSLDTTTSVDLGSTTFQWKDLYLRNAPIVSSDRRLKQDFNEVHEAVFKAWANVKFCQYRFKEAVEKKGSEARLHVGLIAQEILEAFKAQGLDATAYGIVCHDSWEDQYQNVEVGAKPAVLNEKGEVVTPEEPIMETQLIKKAGDLWTVRYEEALALEAAYQRWKLQKIEAALAEKGISL